MHFTIAQIMNTLGATDIDSRLEEQLIDGILYAFQEQTNEVSPCLVTPPFRGNVILIGSLGYCYFECIWSCCKCSWH